MNPYTSLNACSLDGFSFQELRCESAEPMPFHDHPVSHFVFVLSGVVRDSRAREAFELTAGNLVYLPAGEPHATASSTGSTIFQLLIDPIAQEQMKEMGAQIDEPMRFRRQAPNWIARRMADELSESDNMTPFMLKGLAFELLATLGRETGEEDQRYPLWLKNTRDYLHAHFREGISVDDLANAVSVHPAHLMRAFRKEFQCTVGEYVRRLRIEYARQLLAGNAETLSEISALAGFSDQSHFIRTFRGSVGMTTSEFRRAFAKRNLSSANAIPIQ